MRPHVRRALAQTIVAIEDEAVAPYLAALREADGVLAELAAGGPATTADLVERAAAVRGLAGPLLERDQPGRVSPPLGARGPEAPGS